jgi:hypothetical protein
MGLIVYFISGHLNLRGIELYFRIAAETLRSELMYCV